MRRNRSIFTAAGLASIVLFGLEGAQFGGTMLAAKGIPGTGTLSGSVEATKPFKAAQVYARNVDKNVVYMVYTAGGRYRAVNLFPGNYEVSVKKRGFAGDIQKVVVRPETNATADFSLRDVPAQLVGTLHSGSLNEPLQGVPLVSYETLYPPGAGRAVLEKTCILCHGPNFAPNRQWDESQWNKAIDLMIDTNATIPGRIPPGALSSRERQDLVGYLVKNFGPDSPKRALDAGAEMPLDERALANAMYVEYYLPPLNGELGEIHNRRMHDPHFDRDGNVWYTDRDGIQIGKLDPRTGAFKDYRIPDPKQLPHGITGDAKGDMWWAGETALGRVDSRTGEMVLYPMEAKGGPRIHGHTPVVDSKQNVWFTGSYQNELGKWDRKTEKITFWKVPTLYSFPYGVVADKDDRLWMAEWFSCKLAMFVPSTEKFTEYSPLTTPCTVRRLSVDSKGTVWYALDSVGKLGKLDPNTGKIVEYKIPMRYSAPYDVWPDRQDNIWISDSGQGGALFQFDPRTEKFTYYPSPQKTDMPKIEITRDGAIWYCTRAVDSKNQAVGVLYPDVTRITTMAAYY